MSSAAHIVALGARTAVGLRPETAAAALRAGISRVQEHPYLVEAQGDLEESVTGHAVADHAHKIAKNAVTSLPPRKRDADVLPGDRPMPATSIEADALVRQLNEETQVAHAKHEERRAQAQKHDEAAKDLDARKEKQGHVLDLLIAVTGALPERPARPLSDLDADVRATVEALCSNLKQAHADEAGATEQVRASVDTIRGLASEERFAMLKNQARDRLRSDASELAARAAEYVDELTKAQEILDHALEELEVHRRILLANLAGLGEDAAQVLRQAARASVPPESLGSWGGRSYLRIDFQTPNNDANRRAAQHSPAARLPSRSSHRRSPRHRRRRDRGRAAPGEERVSAASILLHALREHAGKRRRLALAEVWQVFRTALAIEFSDRGREALAAYLAELGEEGYLQLPRQSHLWDRTPHPALPQWVLLDVRIAASELIDHRTIAWAPELARLIDEPRIVPDVLRDLLAIQRFLAEGGRQREEVPLRERSVELLGDEKRLDVLLRSRLFRNVGIGHRLLRVREVPVPIVWEPGPAEPFFGNVLVLENLHTYDSFRRWNAREGAYLAVIYGGGKAFAGILDDLARIVVELGALEIEYFGDLDGEGLHIPAGAARALGELRLVAAERWYEMLLARGVGRKLPDVEPVVSEFALTWLPDSLRAPVRQLFTEG